jgi:tetratricopeptide (TPR) repeat protein
MSLTSVNLLWQKRLRGLLPVPLHAVAESGHALLLRPDEMEHRTYQVLSADPDGEIRELGAISVETVYRFDGVPDGKLMIGMTADDIYVFKDGKKIRFMADRRVTYADAALSPKTGWFAAGFSDALFASHGVAFGDANGRFGWAKDMEQAVNRVAISGDGRTLAVGLQDGRVRALDNMRNPLWTCAQDEAITAMAMPGAGPDVIVGTELGTVLSLDADGGFRWRSPVGLPVLAVSVDEANQWVASLHSDGTTNLLVCLGSDGSPVWEYELEVKPTGVSLAPNGKFLVVTTANGGASGFEVDFASAPSFSHGGRKARDLAAVDTALEAGEVGKAHELLTLLARSAPWDAEVGSRRLETRARLLNQLREQSAEAEDEKDWDRALAILQQACQVDPWDEALFAERRQLRERAIAGKAEQAGTHEATFDPEGAARLWGEILELDPDNGKAREAITRLRTSQAAELMRQGDDHMARQDLQSAVMLWQQAQNLAPNDDLAERLRKAEVERCVAVGIAHYEAQRLPEATFQLRKALAMDPENETATRYLGYADSVSGDHTIADRFARLE